MTLLYFIIVFIGAHLILMRIYRITTYHAYFWKSLALLLTYSVFVGALLYHLHLHQFFLWFIFFESIWLFAIGRKQARSAAAMLSMARDDANAVRAIALSAA